MSNAAVYRVTKARPMEAVVANARMRLMGHILRLTPEAPAQTAMDLYFSEGKRHVGRPEACLATAAREDLRKVGMRFAKAEDLARVREVAADRERWRKLVEARTEIELNRAMIV